MKRLLPIAVGLIGVWLVSHMAVNCQVCGVSMGSAEVTQRQDGKVGNYHTLCARIETLIESQPAGDDLWLHTLLCARQRLIDKYNVQATEYP